MEADLKHFLEKKAAFYNQPSFISSDPISIPHRFTLLQDIEIAGFFAALFAWGNRTIIINKCTELLSLMDNAPYDFMRHHTDADLKKFLQFKHRTFNTTDVLYFIAFLQYYYSQHISLQSAFSVWLTEKDQTMERALIHFHEYFFSLPFAPDRTKKHIATPARGSHCKRLNMYLRWMVRKDETGVDFGLWNEIKPAQLICPIDVHVARVARKLNLLTAKQLNWKAALELTSNLRQFDAADPVKFDFALFGLGIAEKY
ncbi:MAG TPA: TIGR02757 family protein [Chitinophagaceae bacterium]|nr:TIGR02757 family protein [Chitinophagaceae bacterium]